MLRHAFAALALVATPATAATYTLDLTGMIANMTSGSFTFNNIDFQAGGLTLSDITPFTVEAGDTIQFTVALDGSFVVPKSFATPGYAQFVGINFDAMIPPIEPVATSGVLNLTGLVGDLPNPQPAGCGNCVGLIGGRAFGEAFSFTGLFGSAVIDALAAPYEITSVSISYQINPTPFAAVPEPATWALMIGGFFLSGGLVRARRPRARVTA
ncbi:PEPxxWA-CTERM sorting domain-containing protein [Glacieibacterium frigidum]|uniref:PEP-CTERM sorting domain-containing protein n=1 Tax=Glacieibacterium frigidum TaxID=2593303 RepID=A0A552UI61_9SPHN|nr:PEPxxWA-CTERM sorting domain-containing protein [Glacieibacterium frigidum]TRW17908.1 PEP-CTERM sorting domain-containing protein [Glacieibacterium frigidum]